MFHRRAVRLCDNQSLADKKFAQGLFAVGTSVSQSRNRIFFGQSGGCYAALTIPTMESVKRFFIRIEFLEDVYEWHTVDFYAGLRDQRDAVAIGTDKYQGVFEEIIVNRECHTSALRASHRKIYFRSHLFLPH